MWQIDKSKDFENVTGTEHWYQSNLLMQGNYVGCTVTRANINWLAEYANKNVYVNMLDLRSTPDSWNTKSRLEDADSEDILLVFDRLSYWTDIIYINGRMLYAQDDEGEYIHSDLIDSLEGLEQYPTFDDETVSETEHDLFVEMINNDIDIILYPLKDYLRHINKSSGEIALIIERINREHIEELGEIAVRHLEAGYPAWNFETGCSLYIHDNFNDENTRESFKKLLEALE